jgi:hypothetical protein
MHVLIALPSNAYLGNYILFLLEHEFHAFLCVVDLLHDLICHKTHGDEQNGLFSDSYPCHYHTTPAHAGTFESRRSYLQAFVFFDALDSLNVLELHNLLKVLSLSLQHVLALPGLKGHGPQARHQISAW